MSRDLFSFNLGMLCFLASVCCKEFMMVVGQIVQKAKKNELDLCNLAFSISFKLLYLGWTIQHTILIFIDKENNSI